MALEFGEDTTTSLVGGDNIVGDTQNIEMTHGTTFDDAFSGTDMMDGFNGISIILQLVFFLFYAFFQYMLSKKLDVKYSWMAWVPLLNGVNKLWIAGKTLGWFFKWVGILIGIPLLISIFNWIQAALVDGTGNSSPMLGGGMLMILMSFLLIIGIIILAIKINHGVSTRTGHGKWWTVGLMFAGWLFWPVTALHYEKGDEITPRPFVGWKKVLLIIFGAIIPIIMILGIVAAALFPALTGYLSRARDTARMSHISQLSTVMAEYYVDTGVYPTTPVSGCIPTTDIATYTLSTSYNDPTPTNIMPGCDGSDGTYAYRAIVGADGVPGFVIGAQMETSTLGNSDLPIDEVTADTVLIKGSGQYYYTVR